MFPVCRKLKTLHGPHSTCLMTAETFWAANPQRHSHHLRAVFGSKHFRSNFLSRHQESVVFLGSYLLLCVFFCVFGLCSVLGYAAVRLCMRFQVKLTLYLVMLQRLPIQFHYFNVACLFCLHIVFVLSGGLGFLVLSFVDT
ncbi:hypothetical protein ACOMHN_029242 [Nucella lapillus]